MRQLKILVLLFSLVASTPAWAEPLKFRGLDSGSTRSDVLAVFPQAVADNPCRSGETLSRSADGPTLCEQLRLDGYELADLEFDVSFIFTPTGTLRYVSLSKTVGRWGTDEGTVSLAAIESMYRSLADLVSSKYGPAVTDPPSSLMPRSSGNNQLEWQPGRSSDWQAGGDRISLSSDARESRTAPGRYRGGVHLFYTFARRDEFDRF